MSKHLIITIPAEQKHLSREIAQGVGEYADVSQAPSYTDLGTIKLVLDIVGQGVAIAGGVVSILTYLRSWIERNRGCLSLSQATPGFPFVASSAIVNCQAEMAIPQNSPGHAEQSEASRR